MKEQQIRTHINFRRKQSVIMSNCLIFICLKSIPLLAVHFIVLPHQDFSNGCFMSDPMFYSFIVRLVSFRHFFNDHLQSSDGIALLFFVVSSI